MVENTKDYPTIFTPYSIKYDKKWDWKKNKDKNIISSPSAGLIL